MTRKWSITESSNLGDGFIGKIGYINLNPGDNTKEKALKFLCVLDYHYPPPKKRYSKR